MFSPRPSGQDMATCIRLEGVTMGHKAAITVYRSREEVERRWSGANHEQIDGSGASVAFADAPGDRGTEIVVELGNGSRPGKLGGVVETVTGVARLARIKDELRHFKQLVETGEIPRSDGTPEGEHAGRKLKQRPAQPLDESELVQAGA